MSANVPTRPALLGKIPAQAEFVRLNAQAPVFQSFHRWLEASVEALRISQTVAPERVRFLYVAPDGSGALAGVMAPSRDQVGREFPLAALVALDPSSLAQRFFVVPAALAPFFQDAGELLDAASTLDLATLAARLDGLPAPGAEVFVRSVQAAGASLRNATVADLQRLFEGGGHWYALRTLLLACDPERRGNAPAGGPVSVDCPLSREIGPSVWLELAARRARWRSPPSFLWSEEKLLLTLGSTVPSALLWFYRPSSNAVKLWPLRTASAEAVAAARSALPSLEGALEDPGATLEPAWSALEGVP